MGSGKFLKEHVGPKILLRPVVKNITYHSPPSGHTLSHLFQVKNILTLSNPQIVFKYSIRPEIRCLAIYACSGEDNSLKIVLLDQEICELKIKFSSLLTNRVTGQANCNRQSI